MQKKRTIQSIDRAVDILNYIASHENDARLIDISKDLSINKSTLHGILVTLEVNGLIVQNLQTSRYSLGLKLYELGKVYEQDFSLKKVAHPYLLALADEFTESVHLGIESNYEVLYIDQVKSPHSVRMAAEVGNRDPLHCSSIGKAILASMTEDQVDHYIDIIGLKAYTSQTITSPDGLKKELALIREVGYSKDMEELELGLVCVSSPIKNRLGDLIGVISISGPTTRIDEEIFSRMTTAVTKAANDLSKALTHQV